MASLFQKLGATFAGLRRSTGRTAPVERLAAAECDDELATIRALLEVPDAEAARARRRAAPPTDRRVTPLRTSAEMLDDVLARAGARTRMRGTVDDVRLDVLVKLVETDGMSGRLWIRTAVELLELDVRGGKVFRTRSVGPEVPGERLGDILVAMELVTREDVDGELERTATSGRPLGVALLASGLVRVDQLKEALRRQSIARFSRALDARSAAYAFGPMPD